MMKFVVVLALVLCGANAGIISTGLVGDGLGLGGIGLGGLGISHGVVAGPALAVAHAPVAVKTAVATSYQNNNQLSVNPTLVAAKVAAPVAIAHAPIAVAHAPVALASPLSYGLSLH